MHSTEQSRTYPWSFPDSSNNETRTEAKVRRLRSGCCVSITVTILFLFAAVVPAISVRADDEIANEYRVTLSPSYPIKGDLTGFSQLEYRDNPYSHYQTYVMLWPGLAYSVKNWLQLSGGLRSLYTENADSSDKLELRPFGGIKLFLPNTIAWNIYNYTRYEFRDTQNLDTHDWTDYHRVRSRFGVEFPFTSRERAWQAKTWYGLADVEPIYRYDTHEIDPVYVRGGLGYVLNDRVRLEFIYYAEFTRSNGNSLEHTDNIFQLNIRIGLAEGILRRIRNAFASD
jgi:hypothetical protein